MASQRQPTKEATHKIGDYSLVSKFVGYNARKDKTTLTPDTLISPSKNVLIGTSGRAASTKGYELDGAGSTVIDSGILSNYDFDNFKGIRRNMRAGFLTSAANDGKLQYRYVDSSGTVSWINLMTSLTSVTMSFCDYWDNTALLKYVLWVDGSSNIYSWNGAVTTFASATATTLTTEGSLTWQQLGFTSTGSITIGGVTATYSGGYTTTTLTGVSVDFSATTVGAEIHQTPVTTAFSAMTSILSTFKATAIGNGRRNQVYVGSSSSNNLYISKVNDYTNYAFTSPTRVVGEGALIPLDSPPSGFLPMEVVISSGGTSAYDMYISEGLNTWSIIRSTLSSDNTKEQLEHLRMKVAPLEGAISGRMMGKMTNHIMFIGHDNVAKFFGYLSYENVPSTTDFSYPIIDDMNSYDFTDGSMFYHRNYIYVSIPQSGIIRIYNMTDQSQQQNSNVKGIEDVTQQPWFWEAPITFPISGFYVVDGELYGHNYTTSESYKLFTGGSLNGQDIDYNATFAFNDHGDRTQSKGSDEIWLEGYIKQNTNLDCSVIGDLDNFESSQTVTVNGSDTRIVAFGSGGGALGKNKLGSNPLGGTRTSSATLPAWFHVAKTYPVVPSYLEQISLATKGIDLQWELICYGTNAKFTNESNNAITE